MQKQGLLALLCSVLFESRSTALNLNATTGLLLDMLNILSAMAYNRSSKIEASNWFKANKNLFFGPFALFDVSINLFRAF